MSNLNTQYLKYLNQYPLLTKSVTAGILAALNESLASIFAGEINTFSIAGVKIKHVFTKKVLIMVVYGSIILTPTSHYLYAILNKIFKGPLSWKMKLMQMATSLSTITPILSAMFTSWLSIVNGYKLPNGKNLQDLRLVDIPTELRKLMRIVISGLQKNYVNVLKSSVITSICVLTVAQNLIKPELWVVFFNLVYFFLGTFQNTMIKIKLQRKSKSQSNKEDEKIK